MFFFKIKYQLLRNINFFVHFSALWSLSTSVFLFYIIKHFYLFCFVTIFLDIAFGLLVLFDLFCLVSFVVSPFRTLHACNSNAFWYKFSLFVLFLFWIFLIQNWRKNILLKKDIWLKLLFKFSICKVNIYLTI